MKILHVVGARPNFMKVTPVMRALSAYSRVHQVLVHTGQHYDVNMSAIFFRQLGLQEPDVNLGVGSGSHAFQTAQIMLRFEPVILEHVPNVVVVYGDVNSTVAAALVCAKQGIPVAHVEAGLRSFDRTMPEEINRVLTDQISDLLFTSSPEAEENLLREGVDPHKIHFVGNVMIDTLVRLLPVALQTYWNRGRIQIEDIVLEKGKYALVTLHRPVNVDDERALQRIVEVLIEISQHLPIIFPVHPRTARHLRVRGNKKRLHLVPPLGYLEFLALQKHAVFVITDSGGVQEETTYLGVPCLTVRENTERPITISMGTNTLVGQDIERLRREVYQILEGNKKQGWVPPLWDGHAAERIAKILVESSRAQ